MTEINREVFEEVMSSLDNAVTNGYDMKTWTDEAIAEDLQAYAGNLCERSEEELIIYIKQWKERRKPLQVSAEWLARKIEEGGEGEIGAGMPCDTPKQLDAMLDMIKGVDKNEQEN